MRLSILVYRFGQIGDTVAALPALWALRQHFPEARLVLLSEATIKSTHLPPEVVLPAAGLVDGFEKYPAGATLRNFLVARRSVARLRRQGFEKVVYLVPSERTRKRRLRDRLFFRLAGVRCILGVYGFRAEPQPRRPDGSLVRLPKEADALLQRLKLDGIPVAEPDGGCTDLVFTLQERERAGEWWRQNVGPQEATNGWVAVCTGGKTSAQRWPWERYAEVVRRLIDNHRLFPVVVGGLEDREVAAKLLAAWGTGRCAAGELKVRESAALMAGARFYLGNDTGVMHLAAAVGVPCVGVFSARNPPGMWEPYGPGHQVLRFEVPCAGCRLEVCDKGLPCLLNISVEEVYAACRQALSRGGSAS